MLRRWWLRLVWGWKIHVDPTTGTCPVHITLNVANPDYPGFPRNGRSFRCIGSDGHWGMHGHPRCGSWL